MWELYSPSRIGVRVRTTVGKLQAVMERAFRESSNQILDDIRGGAVVPGFRRKGIKNQRCGEVQYDDLYYLLRRVQRKLGAYKRLTAKHLLDTAHDKTLPSKIEKWFRPVHTKP